MTDDNEEFLSCHEAYTLAGIGRATLYARIDRGEFPPPIYLTASQSSAAWLRSDVLRWKTQFEQDKAHRIIRRRERRRRASIEYYRANREQLLQKAAAKYAARKVTRKS